MASILRVNTLTDASSNNSVPMATVSSGSAKAWFHVDTNGASISDSFNISSHDDDGEGDGGCAQSYNGGSGTAIIRYRIKNTDPIV